MDPEVISYLHHSIMFLWASFPCYFCPITRHVCAHAAVFSTKCTLLDFLCQRENKNDDLFRTWVCRGQFLLLYISSTVKWVELSEDTLSLCAFYVLWMKPEKMEPLSQVHWKVTSCPNTVEWKLWVNFFLSFFFFARVVLWCSSPLSCRAAGNWKGRWGER